MNRIYAVICICLYCFAKAQYLTGMPLYPYKPLNLETHSRFLVVRQPAAMSLLTFLSSKIPTGLVNLKGPDLAFFCKMEDRFRNNFKVFLKIRTGNDESYRKMIGEDRQ